MPFVGAYIRVESAPIYVCNGSVVLIENVLDRRLPSLVQVPNEKLLGRGGDDVLGSSWMWIPLHVRDLPGPSLW